MHLSLLRSHAQHECDVNATVGKAVSGDSILPERNQTAKCNEPHRQQQHIAYEKADVRSVLVEPESHRTAMRAPNLQGLF